MRSAGYFIAIIAAIGGAIAIPLLVPAFRPDGVTAAAIVNNALIAVVAVGAVVAITMFYPLEPPEKPGVPDDRASDDDLDIPAFLRGLSSNRFSRHDDRSTDSFEVRGNDTMHRRAPDTPNDIIGTAPTKLSRSTQADLVMPQRRDALSAAEIQQRLARVMGSAVLEIRFETDTPPRAEDVGAVLEAIHADIRARLTAAHIPLREEYLPKVLEMGVGSWWLRVGIPVIGLAMGAGELAVSWFDEPAVAMPRTFTATASIVINGQAAEVTVRVDEQLALKADRAEAQKRLLKADSDWHRKRSGHAASDDGPDMVGRRDQNLSRSQFRGMIVSAADSMVQASSLSPPPFPVLDWKTPPATLMQGREYDFTGILRYTSGRVLVGAFIEDARLIS